MAAWILFVIIAMCWLVAIGISVASARKKDRELLEFPIWVILIATIVVLPFVCWFYRGWTLAWLIVGILSIPGLVDQTYDFVKLHYYENKSWMSLIFRKRTIPQIMTLSILGLGVLVLAALKWEMNIRYRP